MDILQTLTSFDSSNGEKLIHQLQPTNMSDNKCIGLKPINTDVWSMTVLVIKCLVLFFTVFGNGLVVVTVVVRRSYGRIPSNAFVASLAVTDFLVGVLVMAPDTFSNLYGQCFCNVNTIVSQIARSVRFLLIYSTLCHLCLISYDRYRYILNSRDYLSAMVECRPKVMLAITWAFPVSVAVLHVIHEQTLFIKGNTISVISIFGIFIIFNLIPTAVIIFCYVKIMMVVNQIRLEFQSSSLLCFQRRTLHLTLLICGFLISWVPGSICVFVIRSGMPVHCDVKEIVVWLFYVNSFINPFVYSSNNPRFRNAMLTILTCGFHAKLRPGIVRRKSHSNDLVSEPSRYNILRFLTSGKNIDPSEEVELCEMLSVNDMDPKKKNELNVDLDPSTLSTQV